jgi:hypothetical protein
LGGWAAPASYLGLDTAVVAELARASLGSPAVATLRSGELAVGAMLAALALRGEDALLDQMLPLAGAELRIHRYTVGELQPLAVHSAGSVGEMLRSLSHCAVQPPGETWEAVAHDGRSQPVAIAASRSHELRWLQPPAPGTPNTAPWVATSTTDPAPGSTVAEWSARLAAASADAPLPPPDLAALDLRLDSAIASAGSSTGRGEPTPAFPSAPAPSGMDLVGSEQLRAVVRQAVEQALAAAPIELDLDAATLEELRDSTALERLIETVALLERRVGGIDAMGRQIAALSASIDDLADSTRALLRHQWDNMPPAGFWMRVQKADEELRRSIDDLTTEVRTRQRSARPKSTAT